MATETDKLTPGMLRDLADLSAEYEDPNKNYDSWGHMLMAVAARREAEQKPYVAQARLQDEPPGPRTGPSKEGAGVERFLYPIDDQVESKGLDSADAHSCPWCKTGECQDPALQDKPAPAADDLVSWMRHEAFESSDKLTRTQLTEAADRIEAQAREIADLTAKYRDRNATANRAALNLGTVSTERDTLKARVAELEAAMSAWSRTAVQNGTERDAAEAKAARLVGRIRACIDMTENCAGVPMEPDSLPQMVKHELKAALSEAGHGK